MIINGMDVFEAVAKVKELEAENHRLRQARGVLAGAIHRAAVTAGICGESVGLSGSQLVMLCADLGAAAKRARAPAATEPDASAH